MTYVGQVQLPDRPDILGEWMNYTGKDINATSGSRTASTANLVIGEVLSLDPYGQDSGFGKDLANPTTSLLFLNLWVVLDVPAASRLGGRILAAPIKSCQMGVPAMVEGTSDVAVGDALIAVAMDTNAPGTSKRYLVVSTTDPTTPKLTLTPKAIAAAAQTANSAVLTNVMPG